MSLQARDVSYSIDGRVLLAQVSITIAPSRVHVILGPNGAGKSTLLRCLAGDIPAGSGGAITLDDRPLANWPAVALARRRAVMTQREHLPFPFTARQVVTLGRLPWQRAESLPGERAIIEAALQDAGAAALEDRLYPSLSGGERARVQFARALAQIGSLDPREPRYLLLDEPTASFDFAFQHECLATVRRLARDGLGAAVILHDPNLAARYADDVTLLRQGKVIASGTSAATLTPALISVLYGIEIASAASPGALFIVPR